MLDDEIRIAVTLEIKIALEPAGAHRRRCEGLGLPGIGRAQFLQCRKRGKQLHHRGRVAWRVRKMGHERLGAPHLVNGDADALRRERMALERLDHRRGQTLGRLFRARGDPAKQKRAYQGRNNSLSHGDYFPPPPHQRAITSPTRGLTR